MADFQFQKVAIPAVCILISFLAYSSQILFLYLDPRPLSWQEIFEFNVLVFCIWICYYRACSTDPGDTYKYEGGDVRGTEKAEGGWEIDESEQDGGLRRTRWCRKCDRPKPPRAHHCKTCGRCIPKMDHHCPWTSNCVSHYTFPHFIRFLFYAVVSMVMLEYFLYIRCAVLWEKRPMPSYLGPTLPSLTHLFLLTTTNTLTLLLLLIMLIRTIYTLATNTTTIESWEISRHERLLRRSRVFGGFLYGPGGVKVRIERVEFPYDVGIWANMCQGMGGGGVLDVLTWLWPLAPTPTTSGVVFEENGFNDPGVTWPPVDPDRIPRRSSRAVSHRDDFQDPDRGFVFGQSSGADAIREFKERQERDFERQRQHQRQGQWQGQGQIDTPIVARRRPFSERHKHTDADASETRDFRDRDQDRDNDDDRSVSDGSGEEGWMNPDGERLRDYGVDEDVEFYDHDDIPLSELLRRRRRAAGGL